MTAKLYAWFAVIIAGPSSVLYICDQLEFNPFPVTTARQFIGNIQQDTTSPIGLSQGDQ